MSANELLEKVQELSPSELQKLHIQIEEMLEDIEDNAAADAALAKGVFVPWSQVESRLDARFAKDASR